MSGLGWATWFAQLLKTVLKRKNVFFLFVVITQEILKIIKIILNK